MSQGDAATSLRAGSSLSARQVLNAVSFLNFLQCVVPGGFSRHRSGWNLVNACSLMDKWRAGARQAGSPAGAPEEFRNDMRRRSRALEASPLRVGLRGAIDSRA